MNNFNNILTKTESLRTFTGESRKFRKWGGGEGGSAGHFQAIYYRDFFKKKL